jgi:hypothetical protein
VFNRTLLDRRRLLGIAWSGDGAERILPKKRSRPWAFFPRFFGMKVDISNIGDLSTEKWNIFLVRARSPGEIHKAVDSASPYGKCFSALSMGEGAVHEGDNFATLFLDWGEGDARGASWRVSRNSALPIERFLWPAPPGFRRHASVCAKRETAVAGRTRIEG